jgi:hypothetical protein
MSRTLADAQMRTDAQIQQLAEAQQQTEERLNALIDFVDDFVDRIVRRNGREPQE